MPTADPSRDDKTPTLLAARTAVYHASGGEADL